MTEQRDFYEVLGVSREASPKELKRAYHSLAMKYHPDQNPDDPSAEEKFKEASNAYAVLSDDDKRSRYDRFGHAGINGGGHQGFSGVEDIFSAFGDIFGDFFGGQRGRRQARGQDLRVDIKLTFAEAVWGTSKEVTVTRAVQCDTCHGNRAKPGTDPITCGTCSGKGQVLHSQGFFMIQTTCPSCRGEGVSIKEPCPDCSGRGTQEASSTLQVNVPSGIDDGQTLRLPNKGQASRAGGPAGHLYVVAHVEPDPRFHREEENVLTEVPISYVRASLGGEVEIPTLDEECEGTTTVEVKPGTQPNEVIVRRGEGIPVVNRRRRGDHVIQFKVIIPTKLEDTERELLEQIAEKVGEGVPKNRESWFSRLKKNVKGE